MTKPAFYRYAHIYLALGFLAVVMGFSTTYFSRLGEFSLPYHLHGVSASLWMILLIVQPYLFQKRKLKTHRLVGYSSILLVPTLVIAGIIMMQLMIQRQESYPPNVVYQLAFIDTLTLFGFSLLYVLALVYRKNLKLHARFMVATIFGPLIPALTRLFMINLSVASNFNEGLTYSYLLVEAVLLIIIWRERNEKEIKWTYVPYLIFVSVQHVLMYFSINWTWWKVWMDKFAGYTA